jgi:hypothetical protein
MNDEVENPSQDGRMENSVYMDAPEKLSAVELKRQGIQRACQEHDVEALVEYATTTGGLLDDDLRQAACMSQPGYLSAQNH